MEKVKWTHGESIKILTKRGNKGCTFVFLSYAFVDQCYTLKSERLGRKEVGI